MRRQRRRRFSRRHRGGGTISDTQMPKKERARTVCMRNSAEASVCGVSATAQQRTLIVAIAPTIEQTRRRADEQTRARGPTDASTRTNRQAQHVPLTTLKRRPLLQQGRGLMRDGLPDEASADVSLERSDWNATVPVNLDRSTGLAENGGLASLAACRRFGLGRRT